MNRKENFMLIGISIFLGNVVPAWAAGTVQRNTDGTGKVTITLNGIAVGTEIKAENTTDNKGPFKIGGVTGNGEHCILLSKGMVTLLSMDVGDSVRITAGTFNKDITVTQGTLARGDGDCQVADVPAVSTWGVAVMILLILSAATIVMRRRLVAE